MGKGWIYHCTETIGLTLSGNEYYPDFPFFNGSLVVFVDISPLEQ